MKTLVDLYIRKPFQPVERVQTSCDPKEGRTKQSFADDCDINHIMKKFQSNGFIPPINQNGKYMDHSSMTLHESMLIVAEGKSMFEELPSHVRKQFDNDPVKFLEYAENPQNQQGMIDLGLAQRITPIDLPPGDTPPSPTPPDTKSPA